MSLFYIARGCISKCLFIVVKMNSEHTPLNVSLKNTIELYRVNQNCILVFYDSKRFVLSNIITMNKIRIKEICPLSVMNFTALFFVVEIMNVEIK